MENKSNKLVIYFFGLLAIVFVAAISFYALNESDEDANEESDTEMVQEEMDNTEVDPNIVETAVATDNLSTLVAAVTAAELVDTLSNPNASYTVFAPTNNAFALIQPTVDTLLLTENMAQLQDVLGYHVVNSEVLSSDLRDGQIVESLNGETLRVRIIDGVVYINNAMVLTADIETSNGVVHIIDSVLVPGQFGTVVDTAIATPTLSTLVDAVVAAQLDSTLADPSASYTVFAPTNDAFAEISDSVATLLLPENIESLQNVLTYHVIANEVFSDELTNVQVITTLNGETLTVDITDEGVFIVGNQNRAMVSLADVKTSNGVVHVIDTVLLP
ncbi:MAG: fasciclin domain-containing protein [Candidatus Dojkabacteria bacterium]|nr:fasciclin domain-containing protein [Candidatus Dojkabacteria bacterium]MDQ7021866.1 fasciclin domain-containing protein [Candidatus Dojkabacteria bacterium]